MRNRYGTAFGNLPFEQWNYRAVGAEHVAEAHGDKLCVFAVSAYRLNNHFADSLGRAHNVGRIDRLVG